MLRTIGEGPELNGFQSTKGFVSGELGSEVAAKCTNMDTIRQIVVNSGRDLSNLKVAGMTNM